MCSADNALPMASGFGSTQTTERGVTRQILPRQDKAAGDGREFFSKAPTWYVHTRWA